MSLQAEPIFDVPELTAQVAQAAFPKGGVLQDPQYEIVPQKMMDK